MLPGVHSPPDAASLSEVTIVSDNNPATSAPWAARSSRNTPSNLGIFDIAGGVSDLLSGGAFNLCATTALGVLQQQPLQERLHYY